MKRLFGRLKGHRRLNKITVQGLKKVTVHVYMSLIVTNAMALAYPETPRQVGMAA